MNNQNNKEDENDLVAKMEKIQHKICDLVLEDNSTVGEMHTLTDILSSISATKAIVAQFQREY